MWGSLLTLLAPTSPTGWRGVEYDDEGPFNNIPAAQQEDDTFPSQGMKLVLALTYPPDILPISSRRWVGCQTAYREDSRVSKRRQRGMKLLLKPSHFLKDHSQRAGEVACSSVVPRPWDTPTPVVYELLAAASNSAWDIHTAQDYLLHLLPHPMPGQKDIWHLKSVLETMNRASEKALE